MKQVQSKSLAGALVALSGLFCASLPAQAITLQGHANGPGLVVPVTKMMIPNKKCIVIGGEEFCLVKKKHGHGVDQAPGNGAPQGGNGAPPAGDAQPQGGNAGAPPVDNAGTPPADAADTALEPGEHRCPVGYLVLETQNKFGAFCEAVEGFKPAPGTEGIERACPSGYIVLDKENMYHALCEPKEGFPTKPTTTPQ